MNSSIQITVLAGIVGILSLLCRKSAPTFQYWLWSIVVVRLCVPVRIPLLPTGRSDAGTLVNGFAGTFASAFGSSAEKAVMAFTGTPALMQFTPQRANLLAVAWFSVTLLLLLALVIRVYYSYRILRKSTLLGRADLQVILDDLRRKMKIVRPVQLYYSNLDINDGPSLFGIFKPRILLPRSIAETWSAEEIRPILIHELVHVKRFDPLLNWIQGIVQTVYFFHPLVWLINGKIRSLREESCDDLSVLYLDHKSKRYSECLYNAIQESTRGAAWRMVEAGFAERKNSLARRIVRILDKQYEVKVKIGVRSAAVLVMIGIAGFTISCDTLVGVGEVESTVKHKTVPVVKGQEDIVVSVIHDTVFVFDKQIPMDELESTLASVMNELSLTRVTVKYTEDASQEMTDYVYKCAFNAGARSIVTEKIVSN